MHRIPSERGTDISCCQELGSSLNAWLIVRPNAQTRANLNFFMRLTPLTLALVALPAMVKEKGPSMTPGPSVNERKQKDRLAVVSRKSDQVF